MTSLQTLMWRTTWEAYKVEGEGFVSAPDTWLIEAPLSSGINDWEHWQEGLR